MASKGLNIDINAVKTQISKIENAIEEYKGIGKTPFDEELKELDKMNTDYIAKFKVILEDLNDNNNSTFACLDSILKTTEDVINNFEKIEREMISKMGVQQEG